MEKRGQGVDIDVKKLGEAGSIGEEGGYCGM